MFRLLITLAILTIFSCTETPVILPEFVSTETGKVILIDELTGVDCIGCPAGSAKLQSLIDRYNGNVIGVSIHGEFQATPHSTSKYDFRSETANKLENYLKPYSGKPAATINRIQQDGYMDFALIYVDLWSQFVDAELLKPQTAAIEISNTYNPETRELNVSVEIEPWVDLSGDNRISVMLTESHIIDTQKNQTEIILDYEHNHMLRTMLTAFDGDGLQSNLPAYEKVIKNFSYILPEQDGLWVPENMEIIAFISTVTPSSKEIHQAAQVHLIP